jgi:hypothetical protein
LYGLSCYQLSAASKTVHELGFCEASFSPEGIVSTEVEETLGDMLEDNDIEGL